MVKNNVAWLKGFFFFLNQRISGWNVEFFKRPGIVRGKICFPLAGRKIFFNFNFCILSRRADEEQRILARGCKTTYLGARMKKDVSRRVYFFLKFFSGSPARLRVYRGEPHLYVRGFLYTGLWAMDFVCSVKKSFIKI